MATLFPEIKSTEWQISTAGVGIIAIGLQDIRQCLDILLRTAKGTDPLRPQFGSDIFQYVDKPVTVAIPNVKRAILEAVEIWETRVTVDNIKHEVSADGKVTFYVTYRLADQDLIDTLVLYLNGGFVISDELQLGALVINALFPPNPNGKRYTVSLLRNGAAATPVPPSTGFATIEDLYNWIVGNWSTYGRWYLLPDRITGYLRADLFTTASIEIALTGTLRFEAEVPVLSAGQTYGLSILADGSLVTSPGGFTTVEEMLLWVRNNWSLYGQWAVEGLGSIPGDFDSGDFDSGDFLTPVPAVYELVLYSETLSTATLTVTVV